MERRDGEVVAVPGQWGEEGCFEDGAKRVCAVGLKTSTRICLGTTGLGHRGAMQEPDLRRRCQPIRRPPQTPIWSRGTGDGGGLGGLQWPAAAGQFRGLLPFSTSLDINSSRRKKFNMIQRSHRNQSPVPVFCRHSRRSLPLKRCDSA
jgi:hypothetical protein